MKKIMLYLLLTVILECTACSPQIYVPSRFIEGQGLVSEKGIISLPWAIPGTVISMESSDLRVNIPGILTVEGNTTQIEFDLEIRDNSVVDAENVVFIRTDIPGFDIIQNQIEVVDNEDPDFVILD